MEKYKKATFYSFLVYLTYTFLVTIQEYPAFKSEALLFLGGRAVLAIWGLWTLWALYKKPLSVWNSTSVGLQFLLYCCHGQYFSPFYIFAYHQLMMAYAFLFPVPRRVFYSLIGGGSAFYIAIIAWRLEDSLTWIQSHGAFWDIVMSVFAVDLVAGLAYIFFTADRTVREDLLRKFGVIGLQTATVVHDVKGILSTPRMYVDILKTKLATHPDVEVHKILEEMEKHLQSATKMVTELNRISALQGAKVESVAIRDLLNEILEALQLKFRNIALEIKGDVEVQAEKAYLKTVFYNILINAHDNFRERAVPSPQLKISLSAQKVVFQDNGGGFPEHILQRLRRAHFQSDDGSGMGTFVIWDSMRQMQGTADFRNHEGGACIQLEFGKK